MTDQNAANELLSILNQFRPMHHKKRIHPDIPQAEFFMLANISDCIRQKQGLSPAVPGVTPSELASRLGTTPSAVSKMLRCVEEKNWIRRLPDTKDRRLVYLQLTEQGEALLAEAERHFQELTLHLAERMGEEEVAQLVFLLKKLYRILKEECKEDLSCSK